MKKIALIVMLIATWHVSAQTFNGVAIDGPIKDCVAKFQSKGYQLTRYYESGAQMKGTLDSREVELHLVKTPKSGLVWKVAVYFPERMSWEGIQEDFNRYVNILKEKYGPSTNAYSFAKKPYEIGDGYELTALKSDKLTLMAYWETSDMIIMVEASKWAQVAIHYENSKNVELKNKEQSEINSTKF